VRRYLGPAAFLLVATVAVLLVRSGLRSGHHPPHASSSPPPAATTVARTVAKRYWVVRAGDTFGVIAARTGVPLATLQKLNPNVQPTALFIGQRIRLR
jgi:LysM repeat protein